MSLWLCIRFPQLPLESLSREHECPVIVIERQRVVTANDAAYIDGIRPGQSHQTASALLERQPSKTVDPTQATANAVQFIERDTECEQSVMVQMQSWAYGITPTLEQWHNDCLQLEIGSCLQLYRSVHELLKRVEQDLSYRGYTSAIGLASNRRAAWLLSYSEPDWALDYHRPIDERLAALPINLITNDPKHTFGRAIDNLHKTGVRTFAELFPIPASALGRRCGKAFIDWLSSARSTSDDARKDFIPPVEFSDKLWFGFDIRNSVELHPAMERLLGGLNHYLNNIQRVCDTIDWCLLRMRGEPHIFKIHSSEAHRSTQRWLELSLLYLENLTIPEDIEGLGLHVTDLQEPPTQADDLFCDRHANESLYNLVDRLRNRMGLRAVNQLALRDAHLPEDSLYASYTNPESVKKYKAYSQRPFWLMQEPQPIRQEQGLLYWNGPLELINGPERIEDNWWHQPTSRDYYVARQDDGQPLWLYQDRHTRLWYVHGILP